MIYSLQILITLITTILTIHFSKFFLYYLIDLFSIWYFKDNFKYNNSTACVQSSCPRPDNSWRLISNRWYKNAQWACNLIFCLPQTGNYAYAESLCARYGTKLATISDVNSHNAVFTLRGHDNIMWHDIHSVSLF